MPNAKLGTKQVCPSCESKFYDLNKDPVECPKCGHSFDPSDTAVRSKAAKVKEKRAAKTVPDIDEDEDDIVIGSGEEEEEEEDIEAAKELGGDDEEIVRDTNNDDDDNDDGPTSEARVPAGFSEEGIDSDDDLIVAEDSDEYSAEEVDDIGIDEAFDDDGTPPVPSK